MMPTRSAASPAKIRRRRGRRGRVARFLLLLALLSLSLAILLSDSARSTVFPDVLSSWTTRKAFDHPDIVTVHNSWPKGKPYVMIGWVTVSSGVANPVALAVDRARKRGADGIILMDRSGRPTIPVRDGRPLVAAAVRFQPAGKDP